LVPPKYSQVVVKSFVINSICGSFLWLTTTVWFHYQCLLWFCLLSIESVYLLCFCVYVLWFLQCLLWFFHLMNHNDVVLKFN
jgi:hypothetical protein